MQLEKETLEKIYINELRIQLHRKNLNALETAKVIEDLMNLKKQGQDSRNFRIRQLEATLNVGKKELYRYMSVLKLPEADLIKLNESMTLDKISRVTYNLKDKSPEKIKEVVEKLSRDPQVKNTTELEREIAVLNNPLKIYDHLRTDLDKIADQLGLYISKLKYSEIKIETTKDIREKLKIVKIALDKLDTVIINNLVP